MTTPRFQCVGMVASDMAATLAFYRRLGLQFPTGAESEQHVEAEVAGGIRLMWDTVEMIRSMDPDFQPSRGSSLAFHCETPDNVDRVFRDMTEAGYTGAMEPFDAFWGQRYAVLHDPDGTGVDLFAPLNESAE